jgi:hypothetical protein
VTFVRPIGSTTNATWGELDRALPYDELCRPA